MEHATSTKRAVDVVLFSMSRWSEWEQGIVNRTSHLVDAMVASSTIGKVLVVDFLPYSRVRQLRNMVRDRRTPPPERVLARGKRWTLIRGANDRIVHLRTNVRYVKTAAVWHRVDEAVRAFDMQPTVYWSTVPFAAVLMERRAGFWVFDAIDDWRAHGSYVAQRRTLERAYRTLAATADVIFTVSNTLVNLFPGHPCVTRIPNGVAAEHFADRRDVPAHLKQPYIVYTGTIEDRVDLAILEALARDLHDIPILLIGPIWKRFFRRNVFASRIRSLARRYPSLRILGRIPYDELPRYCTNAAVGIIPHRITPLTQSMDPLKLYEYLAAGLPVVTTPVSGTERFQPYVKSANTPEHFVHAVQEYLAQRPQSALVRQCIAQESWDRRWNEMWAIISERYEHAPLSVRS